MRRQARNVRHWVGRDPSAGIVGAQLTKHRLDRLEGRDRERFRAIREHNRVEHQRFHVLGIAFGVLLGDLRAVGGAVQDELFIASGLADGLDVFYRFLGGVSAASQADFKCAVFEGLACPRSPLKLLSAPQLSGSDAPVPRWSKTSRSRALSAGASVLAMNSPSGRAAWPGPPASARTAVFDWAGWVGLESRRSTLNEIVPLAKPVRVSGTGTVVHEKVALLAHGTNVSAPAGATPRMAEHALQQRHCEQECRCALEHARRR